MCEEFSIPHSHRSLHLIGPIQSNKIRKAVQTSNWVHTISSMKHLKAFERIANEENILDSHSHTLGSPLKVLFQVNTSGEASKSGLSTEELDSFLAELPQSNHLMYSGLMTIGPNTGILKIVVKGFTNLENSGTHGRPKRKIHSFQ